MLYNRTRAIVRRFRAAWQALAALEAAAVDAAGISPPPPAPEPYRLQGAPWHLVTLETGTQLYVPTRALEWALNEWAEEGALLGEHLENGRGVTFHLDLDLAIMISQKNGSFLGLASTGPVEVSIDAWQWGHA
jgi:hypothetical protein